MRLAIPSAIAALIVLCTPATAAALRVSPILLEGTTGSDTALTLRNLEPRPMTVQVRVFRWSLHDGRDDLEPTDDVVVSPPIVTVPPSEDYQVRLQRETAADLQGEESYRIVVDEVPNPNRQRNGSVAVVLRYVVPLFFGSPDASQPRLVWSFATHEGRSFLTATNEGDRRLQIDDLAVQPAGGVTAKVQKGLAGYVLGHSRREWPLPPEIRPSSRATVIARSDRGAIDAAVKP